MSNTVFQCYRQYFLHNKKYCLQQPRPAQSYHWNKGDGGRLHYRAGPGSSNLESKKERIPQKSTHTSLVQQRQGAAGVSAPPRLVERNFFRLIPPVCASTTRRELRGKGTRSYCQECERYDPVSHRLPNPPGLLKLSVPWSEKSCLFCTLLQVCKYVLAYYFLAYLYHFYHVLEIR